MTYERHSRPNDLLFPDVPVAYRERRCVKPPIGCGEPLTPLKPGTLPRSLLLVLDGETYFATWEEAKEYEMTAMCPACQDKFYNSPEEE